MQPHPFVYVLTMLLASGIATPSQAQKVCTLTDVQFATVINNLRDWPEIHAFHGKHFPPCPDDGMFAEGYSELVVRTLAQNWQGFEKLGDEVAKDKKFKEFVFRHIDASANESDLRAIEKNSRFKCPPGHLELCGQVLQAAGVAIKEMK